MGQRVPTASPCLGFSLGFCWQKTPPPRELEEHGEFSAPQPSLELSLFPSTAQRCLLQGFLASKAVAIYPLAGMQSLS